MGLLTRFLGIVSPTDTMGPAGSQAREAARRERFEDSGHASPGPDIYREQAVSIPQRISRN